MSTLLKCTQAVQNTNILGCPIDFNEPHGYIFLPKNTIITPAQELAIVTTLGNMFKMDNQKLRAYPFKNVEGIEDGGTDAVLSTSPYGKQSVAKDAVYGFTLEVRSGGMSFQAISQSFTNKQDHFDVMFIDKEANALQATQVATGKKGFTLGLIQAMKATSANGTDPQIFKTYIELEDSEEYDATPALIQMPQGTKVLDVCKGLYQTQIELATPMATGVVEVNIFSNTVNLFDDYSTQIIASSGLIKAYNNATGLEIPITSVAAGTVLAKSFRLTLTVANANYIAVPVGGLIRIECVSPSAFTTAGVIGFSEATFLVTKN
jgi:hypothetical protein